MDMRRRGVLAALAGLGAATALPPGLALAQDGEPFDFERLKALARDLATRPHVPRPEAEGDLDALTYDEGFRVVFDPEQTLALGPDWGLQFFPLGVLARRAVAIHLVQDGVARPLVYDPDVFIVPPDSPFRDLPGDIGFSGFRVVQGPGREERLSYLGASYFRSPGPYRQYGLSARAIALDTYSTLAEEFPDFTRFWLEADGAGRLVIHALMEGPGVVGAYRFVTDLSQPAVTQEVEAMLVFRRAFEQTGLAPLTSMFWYGENLQDERPDWRPEIHDSDGLAIWTGTGERLWRPLSHPPRVVTSVFQDVNPRGFGLIQRDRNYAHYQDDQAFYDRRPSLWVEPRSAWGEGSIRLVEIPTETETEDNIVAFWTPGRGPVVGRDYQLRYRLTWGDDAPGLERVARVVSTRYGRAGAVGAAPGEAGRKVALAFQGQVLAGLNPERGVRPIIRVSNGTARNIDIGSDAAMEAGGEKIWRLIFDVEPSSQEPADVRAFLVAQSGRRLTEVWTGLIFPS